MHQVADVAILWPLHLAGGGVTAEDTVLSCERSSGEHSCDAALDFRC
jgi:hypothetical protein